MGHVGLWYGWAVFRTSMVLAFITRAKSWPYMLSRLRIGKRGDSPWGWLPEVVLAPRRLSGGK